VKSVNNFTSTDIVATESLARKYYKELREKSPFFRAWFGDWRSRDNTRKKVVNIDTSKNDILKVRIGIWILNGILRYLLLVLVTP
jgi:hypothetical protein